MIIECYQDMRAEDPAQAEDFKKQMTERFRKIDVSDDGDDDDREEDKDQYKDKVLMAAKTKIIQVPEDGAGS